MQMSVAATLVKRSSSEWAFMPFKCKQKPVHSKLQSSSQRCSRRRTRPSSLLWPTFSCCWRWHWRWCCWCCCCYQGCGALELQDRPRLQAACSRQRPCSVMPFQAPAPEEAPLSSQICKISGPPAGSRRPCASAPAPLSEFRHRKRICSASQPRQVARRRNETNRTNWRFAYEWFTDYLNFCLWPTAEVPCNYLSCSCSSGHFVNLLLGCTSGLNLAADLGPVPALLNYKMTKREYLKSMCTFFIGPSNIEKIM